MNSAVKKSKNDWMEEKAREVEVGMPFRGSHLGSCSMVRQG